MRGPNAAGQILLGQGQGLDRNSDTITILPYYFHIICIESVLAPAIAAVLRYDNSSQPVNVKAPWPWP